MTDINLLLKNNIVKFSFTKKDGTERIMLGTLHESLLPKQNLTESTRKQNEKIQSVWDLEKNAWRSFDKSLGYELLEIRKIENDHF